MRAGCSTGRSQCSASPAEHWADASLLDRGMLDIHLTGSSRCRLMIEQIGLPNLAEEDGGIGAKHKDRIGIEPWGRLPEAFRREQGSWCRPRSRQSNDSEAAGVASLPAASFPKLMNELRETLTAIHPVEAQGLLTASWSPSAMARIILSCSSIENSKLSRMGLNTNASSAQSAAPQPDAVLAVWARRRRQ